MKLLVISTTAFAINKISKYAGTERLAWDFAKGFHKSGHTVSLLAPDNTIPPEGVKLIPAGYKAHPDLNKEAEAYTANRQIINEIDAVLDLSHQHFFPRVEGLPLPCASIFWHDPHIAKFPQSHYNVVALSQWAAHRFKEIYQQEALFQETILVDPDKYAFSPKEKREDWFVFLGKMSAEKGALKAIEYCLSSGDKLKIIGGKGIESDSDVYQRQVITLADRYPEQIEYLGNVTDDVKIKALQTAKALLYPVEQMEITSMKNIEALMTGCPVVTYDKGAMSHVVHHGHTGYLATTDSEFLQYMKDVRFIEPKVCSEIACDRWSAQFVIDGYLELFDKIIEGHRWY